MRTLTKCALSIAMVSLAWAQGGPIHDLKCENAANPRGLKTQHPRLSWAFDPPAPPRAYQILVASSEEKLNADDADLWDSGMVHSNQKTALYQGKSLSSFQHCYWKVRVWSDYDSVGRYSEPATWQMGLLSYVE
jgi:alpha-L-rhamnosidase